MAITYNESLATDRDRVRLTIGDTRDNKGPRVANGNFSDDEITALLTNEGTWQRAVAACYEILAAEWATKETSFSTQNGSFARSDTSKAFQNLAKQWREQYGYGGSAADEIAAGTIDFSGDEVTALFQREAFGNKIKDWDPA